MKDEMELVSKLKDAESPRPEAYERARNVLRAAMADPGTVPVLTEAPAQDNGSSRARGHRRRHIGTVGKVGIGAGIGVAAAAAAIALVATSGSSGTAIPVAAGSGAPSAGATAAPTSPLTTLAAHIKANYPQTGDASVVIQNTKIGNNTMPTEYFVYADDGKIYGADSVSGLPAAVAEGSDNSIACNVKAATAAASGDLASRTITMIDCSQNYLGLGLSPAAQRAVWAKGYAAAKASDAQLSKEKHTKITPKPLNATTAQEEADNLLWINSFIAMADDGGNPAVREGVLRLLSTMSAVTVAHTTTDGKATLTITAGPEVFGGYSNQVVVIDAASGALISSVSNSPGTSPSVTTYKVYRVSLSDLKAGNLASTLKAGELS